MPFETFLALRYLKARRKRRLARVTAIVAILGIAVGVGALIVALALANGFRDEMREKILLGTAHISVMRADGQPLRDHRNVADQIKNISGVTSASGTTYDGAVIVGPKASAYAVLRGIDSRATSALVDIRNSLIAGSSDQLSTSTTGSENPPPILVGAELAARTGLTNGDVAEIIPATSNVGSTTNNSTGRRAFALLDISLSGLLSTIQLGSISRSTLPSEFADGDHAATVISVQLADLYDEGEPQQRSIRSGKILFNVDWQEANRPLFTALALERRMDCSSSP